jgi:Fe-S cluster biogenesis protein NfuA
MAEPDAGHGRLDDTGVEARLARIDELLGRVQAVAGPTAEAAVEAVEALTEVYGEALARVRDFADAPLTARLADDELLGHLLVLHHLHPEPVERRVSRALERIRPAVRERGGDVQLAGVEAESAHIRLAVKGCGASREAAETVWGAVREAVLAVAPELSEIRRVPPDDDAPEPAFVPLDSLRPGPVTAGGPA